MIDFQNPIYNTRDGGFIGVGLKNARRAERKKGRPSLPRTVVIDNLDEDEDEKAKQEMEHLKSLIVNDENMNEIKDLIVSTIPFRNKLMCDPKTNLKEWFPFFFTCVDLVIKFNVS